MARYECGSCGVFRNLFRLQNHLRTVHNVHVILTRGGTHPRYFCVECDLQFRRLDRMLKHLKKAHNIGIVYEKGFAKKRMFINGVYTRTG